MIDKGKSPVFISYSWGNKKVTDWVNWFYHLLSKVPIQVHYDVNEAGLGENLKDFMNSKVSISKIMLPIVDDSYLEKIKDSNTGVYIEYELMIKKYERKEIYIIPIISNELTLPLPKIFADIHHLRMDMDKQQNINNRLELNKFLQLFDSREKVESNNITYLDQYKERLEFLENDKWLQLNMHFDVLEESIDTFNIALNSGHFTLGKGLNSTKLSFSTRSHNEIYILNDYVKLICKIYSDSGITSIDNINDTAPIDNIRDRLIDRRSNFLKVDDIVYVANNYGIESILQMLKIESKPEEDTTIITFKYKFLNYTNVLAEEMEQ